MKIKSVFVTRKINQEAIDQLKKAGFIVEYNNHEFKVLTRKQLIARCKNKDAILTLLTDKIDADFMDKCPNLKIISNDAVGFDNIDLKAAKKRGIIVTNTPGLSAITVAEHTMALILAISRRIVEADKFARAGKYKVWSHLLMLGNDLHDKTLGIIGAGGIGSEVAKRARAMGMRIIYEDKSVNKKIEKSYGAKRVRLNTLLKQSDFITIHVPLCSRTRHLISKKEFQLMKKNCILINTARGSVVDEDALVNALHKKTICAAAIDVFEAEPNITTNPKRKIQLKDLDNLIMTPHIASASIETRLQMAMTAVQNIIDFAKGKKPKGLIKC